MQKSSSKVVVLATGGTIAGRAVSPGDAIRYRPGALPIDAVLASVPGEPQEAIEAETIAAIDSKDMRFAIWQRLAERTAFHLERDEVAGVVVTHGTDTLEETAYFLSRVVGASKPVVLTGAMRPASSIGADGPSNLADAIAVARAPGACGVLVVLAGAVHAGAEVRKVHPYRLDAFSSGDRGPIAWIENRSLRMRRAWPCAVPLSIEAWPADSAWPWVEIVTSAAGARGRAVRAWVDAGIDGIVVAATGNGTVHVDLEAALYKAQQRGVAILRSSRCLDGRIIGAGPDEAEPDGANALPSAGSLTPVQARVELLLQLLVRMPSK